MKFHLKVGLILMISVYGVSTDTCMDIADTDNVVGITDTETVTSLID